MNDRTTFEVGDWVLYLVGGSDLWVRARVIGTNVRGQRGKTPRRWYKLSFVSQHRDPIWTTNRYLKEDS